MKIRSITIAGFRGFNAECSLDFDETLTLIHGPNSYGKTSLCEGLEWLLYGRTSKVDVGEDFSKTEYAGSYRNIHFPATDTPFVEVVLSGDASHTLRGELMSDGTQVRLLDGQPVAEWPLDTGGTARRPFVLQHSLKDLLTAKPVERYARVARLLGLDDLTRLQTDVVALQTKPPLPPEVQALRNSLAPLEARLAGVPDLAAVLKEYKRGLKGAEALWHAVHAESLKRVPAGTPNDQVLPLLKQRLSDARAAVFAKPVGLNEFSEIEMEQFEQGAAGLRNAIGADFAERYLSLSRIAAFREVGNRLQWLQEGQRLLQVDPARCPFCDQPLGEGVADHIAARHAELSSKAKGYHELQCVREQITRDIAHLRDKSGALRGAHQQRLEPVLALETDLEQLRGIFGEENSEHWESLNSAIDLLGGARARLDAAWTALTEAVDGLATSVTESTESDALLSALGKSLAGYLDTIAALRHDVNTLARTVTSAGSALTSVLDRRAGTEPITVLVDLAEMRPLVERKMCLDDIERGLSDLRKTVDQFVQEEVNSAVSDTLTGQVLDWYRLICTEGDPDVHFSGFGMGVTKGGDLKSRRVEVRATSYGKDLVSAISCLSESKLNALGLSIGIARCLSGSSGLGFIVLDDPIQSWDAEHEIKFVEVVAKLAGLGRQITVLSHNDSWTEHLRLYCRALNGRYFCITGYTVAGPTIAELPWCPVEARLKLVQSTCNNRSATPAERQNADVQFRFIINDKVAQIAHARGRPCKRPSQMNAEYAVRQITEMGFSPQTVTRARTIYKTSDSAHHSAPDYHSNKDTTQTYLSWIVDWVNEDRNAGS